MRECGHPSNEISLAACAKNSISAPDGIDPADNHSQTKTPAAQKTHNYRTKNHKTILNYLFNSRNHQNSQITIFWSWIKGQKYLFQCKK